MWNIHLRLFAQDSTWCPPITTIPPRVELGIQSLALQYLVGISPCDLCADMSRKRLHNRHARSNISNVDFKHPCQRIRNTDPGEVRRLNLISRGSPCDCDAAGHDTKAHENAQCSVGLAADIQVAQEIDGENGADEVGQEGKNW